MTSEARALIVEFVNADQFPGRISQLVPFVRGYFAFHGVKTRWIRFGMSTTHLLEHGSDEFTFSDDELERVLAIARELRPTILIATDPLRQPQLQAICAAAGDPEVFSPPLFPGMPGAPFLGTRSFDEPGFRPDYLWEAGNEGATRHDVDNIYLDLGERCGHPRPAAQSDPYASLTDSRVANHRGCTFCTNWCMPSKAVPVPALTSETTRSGWVSRQVEAVAQSRLPDRLPHALLLTVVPNARVLEECVDAMHRTGLCAQVKVLAAVRTDQVPWFSRVVRERFAADPELKAGVYASGIESLEDRDLTLFNKGTRAIHGLRAINTLRELAEEFPERFQYTGLTFVLLTPWTTLESLQLNLGILRLLEMTGKEAGNVFQSRLRLHLDLPITALAEHEGLVVDDEPDDVLVMNRRKLFSSERPWRFVDPRLRPLSRIYMRYDLLQTALADGLARTIESRLRSVNPSWRLETDLFLQELTSCQIDVLLRSDAAPEAEELLDAALSLWSARRSQSASLAPQRHRIGELHLSTEALVQRLVALVRGGVRPVMAIRDVDIADLTPGLIARLNEEGISHSLVDAQGKISTSGKLLLAADPQSLARRAELEAVVRGASGIDRAAAVLEAGNLHGYPACCVAAHARDPLASFGPSSWAIFAMRSRVPGPVPMGAIIPLSVPAAGFVPCSPDCSAAVAQWQRIQDLLGLPPADPHVAHVVSLGAAGDGDFVAVRVLSADGDEVTHDVAAIADSGQLGDRLRRAPVLRLAPGQIRMVRQGRVIDLLTASHALWWPQRAFQGEEWQELARGVAFAARKRAASAPEQTSIQGAKDGRGAGAVAKSPSFAVRVKDAVTSTDYVFHIARYSPELPCFRRVGSLVLWYDSRQLTARPAALAKLLIVLMQALEREGLTVQAQARWRAGLDRLLARTGLAASMSCEIVRTEPHSSPRVQP